MHRLLTVLALIPIFLTSGSVQAQAHFEPIAVVELFTSEGCSSCPPADRLLTKLIAETEKDHRKIFPLSFHVDYWDRLGWRDPFSSSSYADRQRRYAEVMNLSSVYTPQIVVNGNAELVGSDAGKLNYAVTKALHTSTLATFTELRVTVSEGKKITVDYEVKGDLKDSEIHFALLSKHESTAVIRGENGGRQLNHTNVVRQFITRRADVRGSVSFGPAPTPDRDNVLVIAYIQRMGDLSIIAAAQAQP
jgi:hypothetical protein